MVSKAADLTSEEVTPTIENAREGFGDVSSKIAFILAKKLGKNPVEIAKELAAKLMIAKDANIEKVEAAGPYLNFYINDKFYTKNVEQIVAGKSKTNEEKGKNND